MESQPVPETQYDRGPTLITWYAAGSAANGFNPIPGTGVVVDFGLVTAMQTQILLSFGFTIDTLHLYADKYHFLGTVINPLLRTLGSEAVALLLARFVGKEATKWIPIVGPVISASAGAAMVYLAGNDTADRCLELAKQVRDAEVSQAAV